jgi:hypothetical protein
MSASKGKKADRRTSASKVPLSDSLRQVLGSREKLRQVQARMDAECHTIVQRLGEERTRELLEETYTLATEYSDLRFTDFSEAESEITEIVDTWRGEGLGLRSLDQLMADAVRKAFTDSQRQLLKKAIYARLANARTPKEMELWAVVNASLDVFDPGENPFLLGTFQTSLVEILERTSSDATAGGPDLSQPAVPVDRDIEALVGPDLAAAAARTPHLIHFLKSKEFLFPPEELQEHALRFFEWAEQAEARGRSRAVKQERDRIMGESLEQLFTPKRRRQLLEGLDQLRTRSEAGELPEEAAELAKVAADLLDRLPLGLHPLLQTLWLVSLERLFDEI